MSTQKPDEKGRSSEVIRIPKQLKTLLNEIKGEYGYGRVIQLLLKDYSEEVLKKKLTKIIINNHFDELIAWNREKKDIYDVFRYIFILVEELPEEDNKKVHEKLKNEFIHFIEDLRKGEKRVRGERLKEEK